MFFFFGTEQEDIVFLLYLSNKPKKKKKKKRIATLKKYITKLSTRLLKWKGTNIGVVTLDGKNVSGFIANDNTKIESAVNKLPYVHLFVVLRTVG